MESVGQMLKRAPCLRHTVSRSHDQLQLWPVEAQVRPLLDHLTLRKVRTGRGKVGRVVRGEGEGIQGNRPEWKWEEGELWKGSRKKAEGKGGEGRGGGERGGGFVSSQFELQLRTPVVIGIGLFLSAYCSLAHRDRPRHWLGIHLSLAWF